MAPESVDDAEIVIETDDLADIVSKCKTDVEIPIGNIGLCKEQSDAKDKEESERESDGFSEDHDYDTSVREYFEDSDVNTEEEVQLWKICQKEFSVGERYEDYHPKDLKIMYRSSLTRHKKGMKKWRQRKYGLGKSYAQQKEKEDMEQ